MKTRMHWESVGLISQTKSGIGVALFLFATGLGLQAQTTSPKLDSWDWPQQQNQTLVTSSDGRFRLSAELRYRYEFRGDTAFGTSKDAAYGLTRERLGVTWKATDWLTFGGMIQDARAPLYGPNAATSLRDSADLQEAYFEAGGKPWRGFTLSGGRRMLNFGEGRLISGSTWTNTSRTYDFGLVGYHKEDAKLDFFYVSQVKLQSDDFNNPILGNRVIGYYGVHPLRRYKMTFESYFLRRLQNRPGGYNGGSQLLGTDRIGFNAFGGRMLGPLAGGWKFSTEAVGEMGSIGAASLRAAGFAQTVTRRYSVKKHNFDLLGEYKYASGNGDPSNPNKTSTFDQMFGAFHDKFGHEDLIGWRNIHNARAMATFALTRTFAVNYQYTDFWLASAKDYLYNGSGSALFRSATGTAGRHVGREHDVFFTWKHGPVTWGTGVGYFNSGAFLKNTGHNAQPLYAYVFTGYGF